MCGTPSVLRHRDTRSGNRCRSHIERCGDPRCRTAGNWGRLRPRFCIGAVLRRRNPCCELLAQVDLHSVDRGRDFRIHGVILICLRKHVKSFLCGCLRKDIMPLMSRKEDGDETAAALVRKRWNKTPASERSAHARRMAEARWAGHEAKRPASSRKPVKMKRGRPPKKQPK